MAERYRSFWRSCAWLSILIEPFQNHDFAEFWQALDRGAGPAGEWLASLDADARERAHEELFRQLGSPAEPFELDARAFAVSVTPQ